MICDRISDDIPPQMKILNMVISILKGLPLLSWLKLEPCKSQHVIQLNVTLLMTSNYSKSIFQDIRDMLLQIFDVIQSDVALQ